MAAVACHPAVDGPAKHQQQRGEANEGAETVTTGPLRCIASTLAESPQGRRGQTDYPRTYLTEDVSVRSKTKTADGTVSCPRPAQRCRRRSGGWRAFALLSRSRVTLAEKSRMILWLEVDYLCARTTMLLANAQVSPNSACAVDR
jgi:hypothetical protein